MELAPLLVLLVAGLFGGFIAGLIGIGGGVVFAPVLFYFFSAMAPEVATPLALGTSLFCTLVTACAGAWAHRGTDRLRPRVAATVGLGAAAAVLLMTTFVTTQPWYTQRAFQAVFAAVLLIVVARMVQTRRAAHAEGEPERRAGAPALTGVGVAAGALASAAGVGGGVILVPAYSGLLRLPIRSATATSLLTIVVISAAGVAAYAVRGWGADVPPSAWGYVAPLHGLALVLPAVFTARLGVRTAERAPTALVRRAFALFALFVALRMAWNAVVG